VVVVNIGPRKIRRQRRQPGQSFAQLGEPSIELLWSRRAFAMSRRFQFCQFQVDLLKAGGKLASLILKAAESLSLTQRGKSARTLSKLSHSEILPDKWLIGERHPLAVPGRFGRQ
jgi:hypothetical protein